jgi:uridine kinase
MITQTNIEAILTDVKSATTRCGSSILVTIDGPAGSGKTTLANQLENQLLAEGRSVVTIHADDIYNGWQDALGESLTQLLTDQLLPGIASGAAFQLPRFDWYLDKYSTFTIYPPSSIFIFEGVGSGQRVTRVAAALTIWIDIPDHLGLRRALERDGETLRPQLENFQLAQYEHFLKESTEAAADYRLPGAP